MHWGQTRQSDGRVLATWRVQQEPSKSSASGAPRVVRYRSQRQNAMSKSAGRRGARLLSQSHPAAARADRACAWTLGGLGAHSGPARQSAPAGQPTQPTQPAQPLHSSPHLLLHATFLARVTAHKHPSPPHPFSSLLPLPPPHSPLSLPPPFSPLPSDTRSRWCNPQFSGSRAWAACVT